MKDSLLQTPQKDSPSGSANRRLKLSADRNRKSQKPSQKNLTPEISARAEDALGFGSPKDSIDSSSIGEKSEGNHLDDSSESLSSTGLMTPASSTTISSVSLVEESPPLVQLLSSGSSAQTEVNSSHDSMTPASSTITFQASEGDYINNYSSSTSIISSDGSNSGTGSNPKVSTVQEEGLTSSSVEVEIALKSLRSAQLQVSKGKNVDEKSKRILDALVNMAVEGITQLPVDRDWIDELMSMKAQLVILLIVLWTLAIFAFLFNSSHGITSYNGAVPT